MATPYTLASGTGDAAVVTLPGTTTNMMQLVGWSISEDAAGAAKVILREGTVTGNIVGSINLASGESETISIDDGITVNNNILFVERVSGTSTVTVYIK